VDKLAMDSRKKAGSHPHAGGASGKHHGKGGKSGGHRKPDFEAKAKLTTTKREESEIKVLEKRIAEESPEPGSMEVSASEFTELPLSRYTLASLSKAKFRTMTQIQRVAIPHALAG
jgi:superfamily II DNA/RNA helicase